MYSVTFVMFIKIYLLLPSKSMTLTDSNKQCCLQRGRCGVVAQALDCNRDKWIHFPLGEIKYLIFSFTTLVTGQSAALRSTNQHAMPREFGRNCRNVLMETEYH